MVLFTPRPQRSGDISALPIGVFEDDALLLRLAARSRPAESACPRAFDQFDSDDLAIEDARLVDAARWEL
jgi:hypothetical protein